jgi:hypothetical protein
MARLVLYEPLQVREITARRARDNNRLVADDRHVADAQRAFCDIYGWGNRG